jgi:hypothetical protein
VIVAYYFPHNEGIESGILTEPGQDTGTKLVDLYEVDGQIKTFNTWVEANEWLQSKLNGDVMEDEDEVKQQKYIWTTSTSKLQIERNGRTGQECVIVATAPEEGDGSEFAKSMQVHLVRFDDGHEMPVFQRELKPVKTDA